MSQEYRIAHTKGARGLFKGITLQPTRLQIRTSIPTACKTDRS